jgi:branched-chain amino acid transport system ATP-binding protein
VSRPMATDEQTVVAPGGARVLQTRALTAGYGELAAVRSVCVHVCPGEIVALFGPNGAGKTTLLKACVGILPAMGGEVQWHGRRQDVPLHRLARTGVAYVPEGRSVTTGLSVRDNLRLGRALACRPRVLLVDELSLGLAPLVVERLLGALRHAADTDGLGVLLVEQQAREALAVADRWYLLRDGSLAREGDRTDGMDVLQTAYLASLTEDPTT